LLFKPDLVKLKHVFLLTFFILLADQALKVFIKTHYYLGQEHEVISGISWFRVHFIENEGMAYGWKLGGEWGKMALTLFRLLAVIFGTFYLAYIIRKKYHVGFIICATLIYAGAIGNLIDSMFYGMLFENSDPYVQNIARSASQNGFSGGYAGFLHGKVVDMLYFPIITDAKFPNWVPVWGGETFEFFRPVFNIADASISFGVLFILLFQKRFFNTSDEGFHSTVETSATVNDEVQIS
jgi:signal peptidase II